MALTAAYRHRGSLKTLDESVRVMAGLERDKTLSGKQVADIVALVNALTGEFPEQALPRLPATPGWTIVEPAKR